MAWGENWGNGWNNEEPKFAIYSSSKCAKSHAKKYLARLAKGYEIVCMDGSFHVHEYCLYNSEFLYNMLQGSDKPIFIQYEPNMMERQMKNSH